MDDDLDEGSSYGEADSASSATVPYSPVVDPWSSAGGRLGAEPGSPDTFTLPRVTAFRRDGDGPPAWFLGIAGVFLILAVGAAAVTFVLRPLISDHVESVTNDAIVTALAKASLTPDASSGTVVVGEQQINRSIRSHRGDFQPVEDLRVQIRRSGIEASFSIYGVQATLTGKLRVKNGRIVIVDANLSGAVGRMISVDRIAGNAERAINGLLKRNKLRPTAVTLSDDTLTIKTIPAG